MNIEKYNKIHNELMNRLENGKITVENAKEVHDLVFDKYIAEGAIDPLTIAGLTVFALSLGTLSVYAIINKINQSKEFKNKKQTDNTIDKYEKCMDVLVSKLNKATITYHPKAISVMKKNLELFESSSKELEKLDKKLYSFTSPKEYKFHNIDEDYDKFFKKVKDNCDENNKDLNSTDDYVTDKEIIPLLKKYLKYRPPYSRYMIYDTKFDRFASCNIVGTTLSVGAQAVEAITHKDVRKLLSDHLDKFPVTVCKACDGNEVLKYIKVKFD